MPEQFVLFEEDARTALKKGVDTMSRLIRVTLGPRARTVAIQGVIGGNRPPEILDDGAIIARRTLQIPQPFEDMGAMIIRQLACKIGDTVGDGSATGVVIAQSVQSANAIPANHVFAHTSVPASNITASSPHTAPITVPQRCAIPKTARRIRSR